MEWMKDILGDELYKEFEAKITAHNEAAKEDEDKIKLANLALGKYTGTDHHDGEVGRLTAEKKSLAEQITKLQGDLKAVGTSTEDIEKIKEAADVALKASQDTVTETKAAGDQAALDYEIRLEVIRSGAKNELSVMAHLDTKAITLNDGKILGLSEQLETIKKEHVYLFGEPIKTTQTKTPNPQTDADPDDAEWTTKLEAARKAGQNIDVIRIKQEAAREGVILN